MAALAPAPRPDRDAIRRIGAASRAALAVGGPVSVRGYSRIRNGQRETVRAHQRSDPPGGDAGDAPRPLMFTGSTEEQVRVWLAARRPDPTDPRGKPPVLEGPIGGGGAARGPSRPPAEQPASAARTAQAPMAPADAVRMRQELRDILAPNGVPIGTARKAR